MSLQLICHCLTKELHRWISHLHSNLNMTDISKDCRLQRIGQFSLGTILTKGQPSSTYEVLLHNPQSLTTTNDLRQPAPSATPTPLHTPQRQQPIRPPIYRRPPHLLASQPQTPTPR